MAHRVSGGSQRGRDRVRHRGTLQPRVGGVRQRGRGARARLPRHVPRRRVLAPWRQHPADPRGSAAHRRRRRGPGPRHRDRIRDPGRPGQGNLAARAQDRPRRPPRAERRRRHRHPARPRHRDDLPGDRAGPAHHHGHPAVAQGRNLHLEGVRPRVRREDGRRGDRPRDARRDGPVPIWEGEDGVIAWLLDGPDIISFKI